MPASVMTCTSCGTRNRVPNDVAGRPRCSRCHAALPWLADVGADEFDAVVSTSSMPVLVDLWASWCAPCRAVAPILRDVARERAGSLRVVKVDVDAAPTGSNRLGVQGIPTMVLFSRGREVGRKVGALPGPAIRQWIDEMVDA